MVLVGKGLRSGRPWTASPLLPSEIQKMVQPLGCWYSYSDPQRAVPSWCAPERGDAVNLPLLCSFSGPKTLSPWETQVCAWTTHHCDDQPCHRICFAEVLRVDWTEIKQSSISGDIEKTRRFRKALIAASILSLALGIVVFTPHSFWCTSWCSLAVFYFNRGTHCFMSQCQAS